MDSVTSDTNDTNIANDNCLKTFFKFDTDSCWIDSLFVALFHNTNSLIKEFVDKLQVKSYENNDINEKGKQIIIEIKKIYNNISDDISTKTCNNIRKLLNEHLNLLIKENILNLIFFSPFEKQTNNPIELLLYLLDYVLDETCSENISRLEFPLINNVLNEIYKNISENDSFIIKDIQFINFKYNLEDKIEFETTIDLYNGNDILYLNSIIAYVGDHYVCYYKCNDEWYLYDDQGINIDIDIHNPNIHTKKIGNLENIIQTNLQIINKKKDGWREQSLNFEYNNIKLLENKIFSELSQEKSIEYNENNSNKEKYEKKCKENKYELIFLYLKNKTNKIQKLKELVDNHFDRLKNL